MAAGPIAQKGDATIGSPAVASPFRAMESAAHRVRSHTSRNRPRSQPQRGAMIPALQALDVGGPVNLGLRPRLEHSATSRLKRKKRTAAWRDRRSMAAGPIAQKGDATIGSPAVASPFSGDGVGGPSCSFPHKPQPSPFPAATRRDDRAQGAALGLRSDRTDEGLKGRDNDRPVVRTSRWSRPFRPWMLLAGLT